MAEEIKAQEDNDYKLPKNKVVTIFKSLITIIGLLANLTTLITLTLNNDEFPRNGRIFLFHQAIADTIVCLIGIGIYTQDFMWLTGNSTFDLLLCQAWHGQVLYWGTVLISVWNVVLIAFERFIVINKVNDPGKYRVITGKDISKIFISIYSLSFILMLPAYFTVKYEVTNDKPKCEPKY